MLFNTYEYYLNEFQTVTDVMTEGGIVGEMTDKVDGIVVVDHGTKVCIFTWLNQ